MSHSGKPTPDGDDSAAAAVGGEIGLPIGALIAERYRVEAQLGRGGMGVVYRVFDRVRKEHLALKQLHTEASNQRLISALFEREYRTLAELDHPRVIRVFDYGLAEAGAYYTMELLDGCNLVERAPLPFREACRLAHDVCSCLALLHARRLIHRDVTPQNLRCTSDGRAILLDFGAMTSIGSSERVVGTPAFAAPEAAHGSNLDARTDLYSLGATLYYALTGRTAYAARSFSELLTAWSRKPPLPSEVVPGIPARLDALVMGLLSLEAAQRPRSASEVMQQLATVAGLDRDERLDLASVYLTRPMLLGRAELLSRVERRASRAARGQSRRGSGLLLVGPPGSGRSRALDACALEAASQGLVVLRANAKLTGARPFALIQELTTQLCERLPRACRIAAEDTDPQAFLFEPQRPDAESLRLRPLAIPGAHGHALQLALERFWLRVAAEHALAILVDDLERVDRASGACLAALSGQTRDTHLLPVFASGNDEPEASNLVAVIGQRCTTVSLEPLGAREVGELCASIFGDVPHVERVGDRIYRISQGNPRACMELARHLVECGSLRYDAGSWTLPPRLELADLPPTADDALRARAERLSPHARWLAEIHALSAHGALSVDDHRLLAEQEGMAQLSEARSELLSSGVLSASHYLFSMANDAWAGVIERGLSEAARRERHRALLALGTAAGKHELANVAHALAAGLHAQALERLLPLIAADSEDPAGQSFASAPLRAAELARLFAAALAAAEELGRPRLEIAELQRWLCSLSSVTDEAYYARVAPSWLLTLARDTGLRDWRELAEITDPQERLQRALLAAHTRHAQLPAAERGYPIELALKHLVQYLVASISYVSRTFDTEKLLELPGLLEPFTSLSPLLAAMHQSALATCEIMVEGRLLQARERWQKVYLQLGEVPPEALKNADMIRNAIGFALGSLEGARGIANAEEWAELLEQAPSRHVDAMHLRKIIQLQRGDLEGAERCRRDAELLALRTGIPAMFSSTLVIELLAHAMADDLSGVLHVGREIEQLAECHPGWLPYAALARGHLELQRGDYAEARRHLEAGLALCPPDPTSPRRSLNAWLQLSGAHLRALLGLGAFAEARERAEWALQRCAELSVLTTDELERGLALAEARLGDAATAAERLERLIARQGALGVRGLHLGASFEARARVAVLAGDRVALLRFGELTAREYRHGRGSGLGARYERLMEEARRLGLAPLRSSELQEPELAAERGADGRSAYLALLTAALRTSTTTQERAGSGLRLICEAMAADGGYLYLVQPDGSLTWVASHAADEPGERELERARSYFERAKRPDLGPTVMPSARDLESTGPDDDSWTNARGLPERAWLLTADETEARHVAVVVLVATRANAAWPQGHAVLGALGQCLLAAGDTQGACV